MSVTATLAGSIQLTDNIAGDTSLSKAINQSYTGTNSGFTQNQLIGTSPVNLNLPGSPVEFIYVRNLATVIGTTLTVTMTPYPSGSANNVVLPPGGALTITNTDTTQGVSAISLTASAAGTPCEYILAA